MTTPYTARSAINELHDMIDKHVPQAEAKLQVHYDKAAETRALLKRIGCWPTDKRKAQPPRKKSNAPTMSKRAKKAYEWAVLHDKTTIEAADHWRVTPDSIHSYRQYRKLPKLRK